MQSPRARQKTNQTRLNMKYKYHITTVDGSDVNEFDLRDVIKRLLHDWNNEATHPTNATVRLYIDDKILWGCNGAEFIHTHLAEFEAMKN